MSSRARNAYKRALFELETFNDESDDFMPDLIKQKVEQFHLSPIAAKELVDEINAVRNAYLIKKSTQEICKCCGHPL